MILLLVFQLAVAQGPDIASYATATVNPTVAAIEAWRAPHRACALERLALSEAVGNGLALTLKHFVMSPRPCLGCAPDGFPSGHSMNAMIGFSSFDWKVGLSFGLATGVLRHDANRHTWPQIVAGLGIGALSEGAGHLLRC